MYEDHKKKILTFYTRQKRLPGYQEIMGLTGFRSKNAVFKLLERLADEGIIEKDGAGKISPRNLIGGVKLLGLVEAGWPSPAEEELVDTMSLDDYLVQNRDATYMLRVKGDSMIDAGIHEGDLLLVERVQSPKVNKIVIAEVDGEWTVKYLRKKDGVLFLEPANEAFKPIYPKDKLNVIAVVIGVIRKY